MTPSVRPGPRAERADRSQRLRRLPLGALACVVLLEPGRGKSAQRRACGRGTERGVALRRRSTTQTPWMRRRQQGLDERGVGDGAIRLPTLLAASQARTRLGVAENQLCAGPLARSPGTTGRSMGRAARRSRGRGSAPGRRRATPQGNDRRARRTMRAAHQPAAETTARQRTVRSVPGELDAWKNAETGFRRARTGSGAALADHGAPDIRPPRAAPSTVKSASRGRARSRSGASCRSAKEAFHETPRFM